MTLIKHSDRFSGVLKVCRRFPGVFVGSVALPMNEVLDFSMPYARVQDLLHFPFHIIVDLHQRQRWLYSTREAVLSIGLQQ